MDTDKKDVESAPEHPQKNQWLWFIGLSLGGALAMFVLATLMRLIMSRIVL